MQTSRSSTWLKGFTLLQSWNRLSIKYKIIAISVALISLRLILNGNYYLGYQQIEDYRNFDDKVQVLSGQLFNFKSSFTEIFFTNGALPQIERTLQQLDGLIGTVSSLHFQHGEDMKFHTRIMDLEKKSDQLKNTVTEVLQTPQILRVGEPEGMILLGRVSAITNHLFYDLQRLTTDVSTYSTDRRNTIFNHMLSMGMIFFCVSILFLIMLYRGVMGPLKLLEEMRRLIHRANNGGHLIEQLHTDESTTEVGRLASEFNTLINGLNSNQERTSRTVNLVVEHVERLAREVEGSHEELRSSDQHDTFQLNNSILTVGETLKSLAESAAHIISLADQMANQTQDEENEGGEICQLIRNNAHNVLNAVASERIALQEISLNLKEVGTIDKRATDTSNLITTASDELLYLSQLLNSEIGRYHTATCADEQERHAE